MLSHEPVSSEPALRAGAVKRRTVPRFLLSPRRLCVIVILFGVAARVVRYALRFPLWGDEGFLAVNFLKLGYRDLFHPLYYGQIVPLGYTWTVLTVTRLLGRSELALRLVAFACGVLALLLLWRFVARQWGGRVTLLAVGFLAAAYYPLRYGTELKPYSSDLLVAMLLIMAAWTVFEHPGSRGRWMTLIALTLFAPWCSYPSVFVCGAVGLLLTWLLLKVRSRGVLMGWALFGLALLLSAGTMYWFYARPHAAAASGISEIGMWQRAFPPLGQPLRFLGWMFVIHVGNMLAYPLGGNNGGSMVTLILVIIGGVVLWRRRRAMLLLLLGPLPLNFIAAALHKYPYGGSARTMLYMAPAFCILAGVGLTAIFRRWIPPRRRGPAVYIASGVFAVISVVSIVRDVVQPYKKLANYEAREVVDSLAEHVSPNDRVVVFNAITEVPYAPFIREWRGDGAQFIFYMTRDLPVDIQWAPPPESVRPRESGATWLVVYRGEDFEFPRELLTKYVATVVGNLGTPEKETTVLQRKKNKSGEIVDWQAMDIYRFEGRPTPASSGPGAKQNGSAAG